MADTKITGLTELETPAAADLAVVVDDVAGAATTKKITLTNLLTFSPVATAAGDILYASSANTLARLAKGAANAKLFMNAGATAPEWAVGIKVGTTTYDTSTASGDQEITGVGFKPSCVLLFSGILATTQISFGIDDGTAHYHSGYAAPDGDTWYIQTDKSIYLYQAAGIISSGLISALGSDGFTITWTKVGGKTGTAVINYVAFR